MNDDYDEFTSWTEDLFIAYTRAIFWTALCSGLGLAAWGIMG